ncbi:MAG: sporulation protein YqfD [Clostridia bacterium]|nr:sporulation protein YqfD [Clostridia bacterium]
MKLWKYFVGYVNISIEGEYPEKLLNRLITEGVALENVERHERMVTVDIKAPDIKKLRSAAHGCGCGIHIIKRYGFTRIRRKLVLSRVFLVLMLVFAAGIIAASTRVWMIKIDTVSIPEEDIKSTLNELGVTAGIARSSIKNSEIAHAIAADPRVVNAKVTLNGVILNIKISESGGGFSELDGEGASNVYADKDCVISYISVTSGRAAVKKGQAVHKGDLLISGDLSELKEGFFTEAKGVVYGEVLYQVTATAERKRPHPARNGKSSRVVSTVVLGQELFLSMPYEKYELEERGCRTLNACIMPVVMKEYEAFELTEQMLEDSDEGTSERARLMAQERLADMLPDDADVKTVKTNCIENEDGSVTAVMTVTTIERIGV